MGPRVLRGGSWNNNPRNIRSANRNRNTPENRNNNSGFRLASASGGRGRLGPAGIRTFMEFRSMPH